MGSSIYKLRPCDILLLSVVALLLFGVLMVQSASVDLATYAPFTLTPEGLRQLIFAVGSIGLMLLFSRTKLSAFGLAGVRAGTNPVVWFFIAAMVLVALVYVPGLGVKVNASQRWLKIGPVRFQPSEIAKWAVVCWTAWRLAFFENNHKKFTGFVATLTPVAAICLLVVVKDFGTAALIGACVLAMLVVGRVRWWHLAVVLPPVLAAGFWFVSHTAYRWKRITIFSDPWAEPRGAGFHMVQSILSFSSGGIVGRGLGNGVQKLGYLPEDTTDFIFSIIAEELGLFGALFAIVLFVGIMFAAWQTLKALARGPEAEQPGVRFAFLLTFGISAMILVQAAINMAVATVSVPTKGLPLPFISFGGTGLICCGAAVGLLHAICRQAIAAEAASIQEPTQLNPTEQSVRTDDQALPALPLTNA